MKTSPKVALVAAARELPDGGLAAIGALAAMHFGWVLCNRTQLVAFDPAFEGRATMVDYVRSMVAALLGMIA